MADAGPGDEERLARLRLIRTPRIGPVSYRQLLARFGDARQALAALPDLALRGGGRAPAIPDRRGIEREMAVVAKRGGRYIFLGDPDYPARLAQTDDAPAALTVVGNVALMNQRTVAMVGARNASAAACRFARDLALGLSEEDAPVVSGLARGIDAAAHVGALGGKGRTIAVIAGGIDIVYPPENAALQERIAVEGLLIAEMPPGTEPRARHFPYRNRIIAGLALGTVVVEAAPRSGSLITARLAGEAGREVMAVPGHPLDPRAQGCNALIREGATLVQSAADILEQLAPIDARAVRSPPGDYRPAPAADPDDAARRRLVGLLGPVPVAIDELIRQSELPVAAVQLVLIEMELAGRLERHAGGRVSLWQRSAG